MKSKTLLLGLSAVLLGACTIIPTTNSSTTTTPTPASPASTNTSPSPSSVSANTTYTLEQVSTHKTVEDCWMVIDGGVYDVTSFISKHPGGKVISFGCGKDASIFFHARGENKTDHSDKAKATKENFMVGTLAK